MRVLPFYRNTEHISYNHPLLYNSIGNRAFRLISVVDELLPFVIPVPEDYDSVGTLQICSWPDNKVVYSLGVGQINHRILKDGAGRRYFVFEGGRVGCMSLPYCKPYYIRLFGQVSEVFHVEVETYGLLKFTLSANKPVASLPYSKTFSQYFYTDGVIPTAEYNSFTASSRDQLNNLTVTFAKLTKSFNFDFIEVPPYISDVFAGLFMLDRLTITDGYEVLEVNPSTVSVKSGDKKPYWSSVSVTVSSIDEYEKRNCSGNVFVADAELLGVSDAFICPQVNLIPTSECDDIFGTVTTVCNTGPNELDFQVAWTV